MIEAATERGRQFASIDGRIVVNHHRLVSRRRLRRFGAGLRVDLLHQLIGRGREAGRRRRRADRDATLLDAG